MKTRHAEKTWKPGNKASRTAYGVLYAGESEVSLIFIQGCPFRGVPLALYTVALQGPPEEGGLI